jgi:hypothetical protein
MLRAEQIAQGFAQRRSISSERIRNETVKQTCAAGGLQSIQATATGAVGRVRRFHMPGILRADAIAVANDGGASATFRPVAACCIATRCGGAQIRCPVGCFDPAALASAAQCASAPASPPRAAPLPLPTLATKKVMPSAAVSALVVAHPATSTAKTIEEETFSMFISRTPFDVRTILLNHKRILRSPRRHLRRCCATTLLKNEKERWGETSSSYYPTSPRQINKRISL